MRLTIFLTLLMFCLIAQGQISSKIKPYTSINKTNITPNLVEMPSFDIQKVINDEYSNRLTKTGIYNFGYEHHIGINFNNKAKWKTMTNGDKLALLKIKSAGALSINIIFSNFYIPKDSYLHIYNTKKTTIVGAYTYNNNNINNVLGTELVKGDEIIIEYFQPHNIKTKPNLYIGTVVHGYEDINNWYPNLKVNESEACNMDVVCSDGIPWEKEIRSVVKIINGGGLCSGSLVNNTSKDGTPYILTANHCSPQSMSSAVFRFNYNSPVCGSQNIANSQDATQNHSINGSTFRARNQNSDFGLVKLNSIPPTHYNVYYAGWNNSGNTPLKTVGIHHPRGDVKKISFDEDPPTSSTFGTSGVNAEWKIHQWDRNTTTEPGSSGSGLWDENHLIVGQLHGGQANCSNSINDYYGKFSESWDGSGATNRLKDWLDPTNSNVSHLEGWDPNAPQHDVYLISTITPNKVNCGKNISPKILIKNNGEEILNTITFKYGTNNDTNYTYNWNGNLSPNDTMYIKLPNIAVEQQQGENNLIIISSKPNEELDGDNSNDTLHYSFINNIKCLAYPNPFKNKLTINFEIEKFNNKPVDITICDMFGKIVWRGKYNLNSNNSITLNTINFSKGVYILKLNYSKESTIQKLIKG